MRYILNTYVHVQCIIFTYYLKYLFYAKDIIGFSRIMYVCRKFEKIYFWKNKCLKIYCDQKLVLHQSVRRVQYTYLRDYVVAIYCNWNMKNFDETEKPNPQIKSHRYAVLQSATLELLLVPKLLSIDNKNPDFQYSHDWWRKSILVSKWHSDTFYHLIGSQKLGSKLYKDILLIRGHP